MRKIPEGSYVQTTTKGWSGVAGINPNGSVIIHTLNGQYTIEPRDKVIIVPDSSLTLWMLRQVQQLREKMGLPANMPDPPTT